MEMTVCGVDCETVEFAMFYKGIIRGRGCLIGFRSTDRGDVSEKTQSPLAFQAGEKRLTVTASFNIDIAF